MSRRIGILIAVCLALPIVLSGQGVGGPGTFPPDWTFKGAALTGTQQIGGVTWKAENGEIVATPT